MGSVPGLKFSPRSKTVTPMRYSLSRTARLRSFCSTANCRNRQSSLEREKIRLFRMRCNCWCTESADGICSCVGGSAHASRGNTGVSAAVWVITVVSTFCLPATSAGQNGFAHLLGKILTLVPLQESIHQSRIELAATLTRQLRQGLGL